MTRVVAVASGKGGVGKTTISANLGIALSILGEDVLLLDMDINMANLELILGLEGKPVTLQDVLAGREIINNAIYEGPGGVRIVPAGIALNNLKYIRIDRMEEVFEDLIGDMEIILLDTAAGLEKDVLTALSLADEIILVTTPEITSVADTLKTKIVADRLGIEILGLIINREYPYEEFLSDEEIESILDTKIIAKIPEDSKLRRSFASGEPLLIKNPEYYLSNTFMEIASMMVGRNYIPAYVNKKGIIARFVESFLGNLPLISQDSK